MCSRYISIFSNCEFGSYDNDRIGNEQECAKNASKIHFTPDEPKEPYERDETGTMRSTQMIAMFEVFAVFVSFSFTFTLFISSIFADLKHE